ncbi:hypothetical protein Deba_2686 [Desulfarculus baarsii DSM 2075]|uniref:SrpA-related protein n=1 Tax=Desulfarculus baarsii (strain ATCC 33931 / DSM 2075 / LMG 7858 / VKM B-1802 / 2st14) TaxID=644282 RepID=E1QKE7_DESB2|nr:putative metalloprotease CJM1_0395 family protein [Desulfarculus baarsii]ADK86040.1 hypothetical protein Deba_2686 [Desulfarculus baarsii DSM 2075]
MTTLAPLGGPGWSAGPLEQPRQDPPKAVPAQAEQSPAASGQGQAELVPGPGCLEENPQQPGSGNEDQSDRSDQRGGCSCGQCPSCLAGAAQNLDQQEQQALSKLQARDREVRAHEQAHKAAGGRHAGSPSYQYETGPDGRQYAVGGEVPIDVSKVPGDPQATMQKAAQIRRAALAPAKPSTQDHQVAAKASQMAAEARRELAQEQSQAVQHAGQGLMRAGQVADASGLLPDPRAASAPPPIEARLKSTHVVA